MNDAELKRPVERPLLDECKARLDALKEVENLINSKIESVSNKSL